MVLLVNLEEPVMLASQVLPARQEIRELRVRKDHKVLADSLVTSEHKGCLVLLAIRDSQDLQVSQASRVPPVRQEALAQ